MRGDDWVETYGEVKQETAKAVLIKVHGKEYWLPKSQLDLGWPNVGQEGIVSMTPWIAGQKSIPK